MRALYRLMLVLAASFVALSFSPGAVAQTCTTSWAAPDDGLWTEAANWTGGVPTPSSVACITVPGTYTVTVPQFVTVSANSLHLGGEAGTQTLFSRGTINLGAGPSVIGANGLIEVRDGQSGTSDGLFTTGTVLVEGVLSQGQQTGLLSTGGTLDVAPGGRLELFGGADVGGVGTGSEDALFVIRGTLEAFECAGSSGACRMNAPIAVDGGTIRLLSGQLEIRRTGSLRNPTFDVAAGARLWINGNQTLSAERVFTVEGTISGDPEGEVDWSGVDLDAGANTVTLAMGGTGFQFRGITGRTAALTGSTGSFVNTGTARFGAGQSWGQGVRDVTLVNQGALTFLASVYLWDDGVLDNAPGGTVTMQTQVSTGSARLLGEGSVVNHGRFEHAGTGTGSASQVQVRFEGRPGSTVVVLSDRMDLWGNGSFEDVSFEVAEGAALWVRGQGGLNDERLWTLDGTLSGAIAGALTWFGSDFAAGPSNPVIAFTGEGLELAGEFGRPTQLTDGGGTLTNTGRIRLSGSSGWGIGARGGTLVNEGRIELTYPFRFWEDGVLRNEPGGVIQMMNGGFMDTDGQGLVENHGLIERNGNATALGFAGTLRSQPGSELRAMTGRLDLDSGNESVPQGTAVTGTAQVRLVTPLLVGGTLSPGTPDAPFATLEFVTSLQMTPTARTVIDIGPNGQSDTIIPASGVNSTTLDGTLVVRPAPGFTPSAGDEWVIFLRSANPYMIQGEFDAIEVEGGVPEGLGFVTSKPNPGVVVLRAVSGVTIEALAESTSEDGPPVRFRITSAQPVPPGSVLNVPLAFEGTAQRYVDYTVDVTGSVARIPGGQTTTYVTVFPLRDDLDEGDETVTLRILPGGDAEPGSPDSATIMLQDGPPTSQLVISGMIPTRGANVGRVTASIFGQGLIEGAQVRLVRGGTTIQGAAVTPGEGGSGLSARFDLDGAPLGVYDLVVEVNGQQDVRPGVFTVETNEGLYIWADINGTPNPRRFRWSTYTLTVGNSGNTNVYDTVVLLRVTPDVEIELGEGLTLDTGIAGAEDYAMLDVETAQIIPLYLYRLDAGAVATFTVRIRPSSAIGTGAGVSYELYPPNPEAAFTWTGDFADFDQDLAAGIVTNWGVLGGSIAWAVEEADDATTSGGGRSAGPRNPWDRPDSELSMAELNALYSSAANFNEFRDEIALNAPSAAGEFTGFFLGVAVVGAAAAVASTPVFLAAALGAAALSAMSIKTAGDSAARIQQSRGMSNWRGSPLVVIADRSSPSTGGAGGGPNGGLGGGAGGKIGGAVDPNDKLGPAGQTEFRYLTADAPATYTIRYENLETATFPAQEVIILDDLDLSVYDLSTFRLGPITLPDRVITPPPGVQQFTTTVDLAPELPAVLLINAGIDLSSGRASWTFVTLDPNTNDLPEDGLVGFLPPNVNQPEGEGAVMFTIDYLPNLPTDTAIENLAEIYFDLEEPIITPVWSNRVDRDAPVTGVEALPATSESPFTVTIAGADAGSGIYTRYLFVSTNDGPFEPYGLTQDATFEFEGELGSTYAFYSLGLDFVGNAEPPKTEAEAVTTVVTVSTDESDDLPRELTLHVPYPNPMRSAATLRWGLPAPAEVDVRLYDLLGREVVRVVDREMRPAGWHETRLAPGLASGVYVLRLDATRDGRTEQRTQRLTIVR